MVNMNKRPKITLLWTLYNSADKNILPSLSIAYLSKVLEENDFEVKCIDCNLLVYGKWGYESVSLENKDLILLNLIKETEKTEPDILAIGCWTEGVSFVREFVKIFKERNPDIKIILGGQLATFLPEKVLDFIPEADYLVRGEGELTLLELVKKISKNDKTRDILGLSYKDNGQVINNPDRPLIKVLDKLPLVDFENFAYVGKQEGLQIITSRGCPCNCSYCSAGSFYSCYRFYSPEYVVKQVKHLIDLYGIRYVSLSDDNVLCNKDRVRKLFNLLSQEDLNCELPASARIDYLNKDVLVILKNAKVPWLTIGIENIVPKVLEYYNRTQNPTGYLLDVLKVSRLIEEQGIKAAFSFVVGSPVETERDMLKNLSLMKKLDKRGFWVYASILRPVPGSFLWSQYIDNKVSLFSLNKAASFPFDKDYLDLEWVCPSNFAFKNDNYSDEQFVEICNKIICEVSKFKKI